MVRAALTDAAIRLGYSSDALYNTHAAKRAPQEESLRHAQAGDVILLVGVRDRKRFIRTLEPGRTLQTHRGVLTHDDLIGQPLGSIVHSHLGHPFFFLLPTTDELVRDLRRESQIIFPKDAGYIVMKLGIKPGARVVEAGTGSGGLCLTLATLVGDEGHVYSYDIREHMQDIARQNLTNAGLESRVTFKQRDVSEGFDETDVDALFLDMLTPWAAIDAAHAALRGSGVLGCLVPTVNQLLALIERLEAHRGFGFVEAEELILRAYKTIPARVRPEDRMVGHTGYLVFARAVIPLSDVLPTPQAGSGSPARVDEEEEA
jgi:tRNA (adenine57-N1/adenine58-N1)-methyltransferase